MKLYFKQNTINIYDNYTKWNIYAYDPYYDMNIFIFFYIVNAYYNENNIYCTPFSPSRIRTIWIYHWNVSYYSACDKMPHIHHPWWIAWNNVRGNINMFNPRSLDLIIIFCEGVACGKLSIAMNKDLVYYSFDSICLPHYFFCTNL